jgi:hypothetical protein
MTKAPKRPRDLNQWAKRMVDIATGDIEDRNQIARAPKQKPRSRLARTHVGFRQLRTCRRTRSGQLRAQEETPALQKRCGDSTNDEAAN